MTLKWHPTDLHPERSNLHWREIGSMDNQKNISSAEQIHGRMGESMNSYP